MIYFKLNDILDRKDITKYSLSKMTGIDNNTIAKICNNDSKQIKLETIEKICIALNITPNDLLEVSAIETDVISIKVPYDNFSDSVKDFNPLRVSQTTETTQPDIQTIDSKGNVNLYEVKSSNSVNKPYRLLGHQVLKNAEAFEKQNGYNPIPTNEDLFEIEQIQERLDLEYTLEDNLETIINAIIAKSDLSTLPIRLAKEIEAYSQQNATSFQFKFILAYRSLYALIVKQVNNKHIIDFISKIIKIYNNGGLYEISNDDLDSLILESENLLEIYKKD